MKYFTKLRMYLIPDAGKRSKILIKKNVFNSVGENFFFQPRIIPDEPKLISFGSNVVVAANVTFITHDVIDKVLNNMDYETKFNYHASPIEVGNNVFIGSNTIILPNIKIGNNVIVAAGSVVTEDIGDNTIVGGNPAKKIGSFDEFVNKRIRDNELNMYPKADGELQFLWKKFNDEKSKG